MSNAAVGDNYSLLKSHLNENTKTYIVLDGVGRMWKVYTASSNASVGDPAMLTEYIYSTPTSVVIIGSKEINDKWDNLSAGWDALFTV